MKIKINRATKYSLFLSTLLLVLAAVPSANAETAEDFYRGKTVRLVIGAGLGGGYDVVGSWWMLAINR